MVWRATDPQGNEAGKVKYDIVRYTRGIGLDLGCGPFKAFPHFLGVDNGHHAKEFGWQFKPDVHIEDCVNLDSAINDGQCQFIFSSHLLEHIADYKAALANWWQKIKPDGYLILYLPHRDLYPRIGTPGANPDHKHDFSPGMIETAMQALGGFDLIVNETRDAGTEYSFLQVYRKLASGETHYSYAQPKTAKTACIVRHGGIGDQLQASALLPELKRQGYRVTVLTTPKGRHVLEHDPHVDDWFMIDKDQVPVHELPVFWKSIAKYYDRFVNLNESVEGTFLPAPGRPSHVWPLKLRQKMLNHNYAEFAAELAEIPFKAEARFYASDEEKRWADGYVTGLQRAFAADWAIGMVSEPVYAIMWVLSGSSPHKFTPHQDTVIRLILARLKRAVVVLVGDEVCKILEAGWEEEPRVRCESGSLDIRQVLALAQRMQLVIGPETGVLNAVANEAGVAKVVMLSHSSHENLTKHWANTTPIAGASACYPCHRLHVDAEFCPLDDEHHAALCQAQQHPVALYHPIDADYTGWARVQMLRSAA